MTGERGHLCRIIHAVGPGAFCVGVAATNATTVAKEWRRLGLIIHTIRGGAVLVSLTWGSANGHPQKRGRNNHNEEERRHDRGERGMRMTSKGVTNERSKTKKMLVSCNKMDLPIKSIKEVGSLFSNPVIIK